MTAAAGLAAFPGHASTEQMIGQPAPDFALRTLDGRNLRLSEYLGEVVLLNFWGTWCGPCRQQMPVLDEIHTRYLRAGLVLLGVNLDEDASHASEMAAALRVSYPVLLDARKQASRSYQLAAMPVTVLIDRSGLVRHVSEGYKPGDEQGYLEQLRKLLNE